jgi:GNAT superfamily N-acetyltransferase
VLAVVELRQRPGAEHHRRTVHRDDELTELVIAEVGERDLADLLPLMVGYCDFYGAAPGPDSLLALSRTLLAEPEAHGLQLIARRRERGPAVGFATLYWTWSTLRAARIAVMNDLFVDPDARGEGVGEALIGACRERCRERGMTWLEWSTAPSNIRAQRLYDRMGAQRSDWIDYGLDP